MVLLGLADEQNERALTGERPLGDNLSPETDRLVETEIKASIGDVKPSD